MSSNSIDYHRFVEDALRDAVRRLLADVAEHGFPGEHYFYLGFRTGHPGVAMPRPLRDLYPEQMTVVLQHQYWNLEVHPDRFTVELSFNASRQMLSIPFAALTTFADPSAEFALRFAAASPLPASSEEIASGQAGAGERQPPASAEAATGRGGRAGEVIRFDPSRRK